MCSREIDRVRERNRKRVNNTHAHTQREIQRQRDVLYIGRESARDARYIMRDKVIKTNRK